MSAKTTPISVQIEGLPEVRRYLASIEDALDRVQSDRDVLVDVLNETQRRLEAVRAACDEIPNVGMVSKSAILAALDAGRLGLGRSLRRSPAADRSVS